MILRFGGFSRTDLNLRQMPANPRIAPWLMLPNGLQGGGPNATSRQNSSFRLS